MATTTPAGVSTENSTFTTIISVVALIAIVALIYFIARGRTTQPAVKEKVAPPVSQQQPPAQPAP
jgi:heme/copper-type cytochrome/quinol oxidase subunit 2